MAENVTLARPYAEAAFRLAREENQLDSWYDALARMAAVAADVDMKSLLDNPKVDHAAATKVLLDVIGSEISSEQKNFVRLLAENQRVSVLAEIHQLFAEHKNAAESVKDAKISSAFPIDNAALDILVGDLQRRFHCKIQASVEIEPELIGGVRIAVGDQVIDASVRGKLALMATALKN